MKAYATGHTGNLGSAFPESVVPLTTRLERSVADRVSELRTKQLPDVLIHSAALVPVQKCNENPGLAHALNVEGTERWFRAAGEFGVPKFVYVSTSHIFKPTKDVVRIGPLHPPSPVAVYGQTKLQGELRLREVAKEFPETQILICRVFSLISRAMRPGFLYTEMNRRAREKDFSPIAGLRNSRDFIFADDACRRILTIAERAEEGLSSEDPASGVYHVCTGRAQTVREIAEAVFREYSLPAETISESPQTSNTPANSLVGLPTFLRGETSLEFSTVSGEIATFVPERSNHGF